MLIHLSGSQTNLQCPLARKAHVSSSELVAARTKPRSYAPQLCYDQDLSDWHVPRMEVVNVHIAGGDRHGVMKALTQMMEGIEHVFCCRYTQVMLRAVDSASTNDFTSRFE